MQTADYVNRMAQEALKRCSSRGTAGGCEREADCGTEGVRKEHPEIRLRWMHFFGRKSFCAHTC